MKQTKISKIYNNAFCDHQQQQQQTQKPQKQQEQYNIEVASIACNPYTIQEEGEAQDIECTSCNTLPYNPYKKVSRVGEMKSQPPSNTNDTIASPAPALFPRRSNRLQNWSLSYSTTNQSKNKKVTWKLHLHHQQTPKKDGRSKGVYPEGRGNKLDTMFRQSGVPVITAILPYLQNEVATYFYLKECKVWRYVNDNHCPQCGVGRLRHKGKFTDPKNANWKTLRCSNTKGYGVDQFGKIPGQKKKWNCSVVHGTFFAGGKINIISYCQYCISFLTGSNYSQIRTWFPVAPCTVSENKRFICELLCEHVHLYPQEIGWLDKSRNWIIVEIDESKDGNKNIISVIM